jgi:hypothetical protein
MRKTVTESQQLININDTSTYRFLSGLAKEAYGSPGFVQTLEQLARLDNIDLRDLVRLFGSEFPLLESRSGDRNENQGRVSSQIKRYRRENTRREGLPQTTTSDQGFVQPVPAENISKYQQPQPVRYVRPARQNTTVLQTSTIPRHRSNFRTSPQIKEPNKFIDSLGKMSKFPRQVTQKIGDGIQKKVEESFLNINEFTTAKKTKFKNWKNQLNQAREEAVIGIYNNGSKLSQLYKIDREFGFDVVDSSRNYRLAAGSIAKQGYKWVINTIPGNIARNYPQFTLAPLSLLGSSLAIYISAQSLAHPEYKPLETQIVNRAGESIEVISHNSIPLPMVYPEGTPINIKNKNAMQGRFVATEDSSAFGDLDSLPFDQDIRITAEKLKSEISDRLYNNITFINANSNSFDFPVVIQRHVDKYINDQVTISKTKKPTITQKEFYKQSIIITDAIVNEAFQKSKAVLSISDLSIINKSPNEPAFVDTFYPSRVERVPMDQIPDFFERIGISGKIVNHQALLKYLKQKKLAVLPSTEGGLTQIDLSKMESIIVEIRSLLHERYKGHLEQNGINFYDSRKSQPSTIILDQFRRQQMQFPPSILPRLDVSNVA